MLPEEVLPMIGRRQLLGAAAGSVALANALASPAAQAGAVAAGGAADAARRLQRGGSAAAARGVDGRLVRLGTLDLESEQDFTRGFRRLQSRLLRAASHAAFERVLAREGLDPTAPITVEQLRKLVEGEPGVNIAARAWLSNQLFMWKTLHMHFHEHADEYLAEMEASDRSGPGMLEFAPQLAVPDYARHEIHIQPGGYVGDPFAGHMYHYGTNSFYTGTSIGHNDQDEAHANAASRLPLPPDGKVRRILDMGCGIGQLAVALKERFPEAEVWGIDVAAPMIRYGHMRANRLGVAVNFSQRLAEQTDFPDDHFDLVTSFLLHHEVPAATNLKIIDEARRITRPGGVFYPLDFGSGGAMMPPRQMYGRWWDHRWNNEAWSLEYHALSFTEEIGRRGFGLVRDGQAVIRGYGVRHGIKV
jgi:ubiquinone/menaquinone biosynthesis C-methylase UbiE